MAKSLHGTQRTLAVANTVGLRPVWKSKFTDLGVVTSKTLFLFAAAAAAAISACEAPAGRRPTAPIPTIG